MNILTELEWRGLIADCTDAPTLRQRPQPITLYCGFDPTADSLHVGHLVPLLALRRFQELGHHPIAVAGGATGGIGDPSFKSAERQLLTKDQIKANVEAVRPQLASCSISRRRPIRRGWWTTLIGPPTSPTSIFCVTSANIFP